MPRGKPPNPHRDAIRMMYADGVRHVVISRRLGVSVAVVARAVRDMPRVRVLTVARAIRGAGYRFGSSGSVGPDCMAVVAAKIRGNETILDCMARLVVQGYGNPNGG